MLRPWLALGLVAVFLLVGSAPARADEAKRARSVYHVLPWTDGGVILLTSLGSILPLINQDHLIHPRCPCQLGEVNALDRHVIGNESRAADILSDATLGLAVSTPAILDAVALGFSPVLLEDLTIYAEVLSVSGAFATLAKFTVQRPIPRVYAGQSSPSNAANYGSFYSGHTDLTFSALSAAAVTTDLRYHWGAWPWVITGALGLSVAEERVLAGRHFYTDVAMATVAGTFFGVSIPLLHRLDSPAQSVSVSGTLDGYELAWTRHF